MNLLYQTSESESYFLQSIDSDTNADLFFSLDRAYDDTFDLFKILGAEGMPEIPYCKLKESLGLNNKELLFTIPEHQRSWIVNLVLEKVDSVLSLKENQVYVESYLRQKSFLRSLQLCC